MQVDGKFLVRSTNRVRLHGVTYGPFAANAEQQPFPAAERVRNDFARMRQAGINALRTYHLPPSWFLDLADEQAMSLLIDVPWARNICFLDSAESRREARRLIRELAQRSREHPCIAACSIGNEIPSDIVRWHGARRVERFLAELRDVAKQADSGTLVTYANYPPTEYLDLSFLDFLTFNVYLHDRDAFARYLLRLQNLAGEKPLVLGEIGMDTLRHGEAEQADFLAGHLREATLTGLAGTFVFSWTDDWHTGGAPVEDWAFGITDVDRNPKRAYHVLGAVLGRSPAALLEQAPRVSVVVCSHNGGRTLDECLRSLLALDYPDYEIILVNDGSTDDTRAIAARFPAVQAIHQGNQGLSAARNVGLAAATGSVVAYTDSDCYADPDWLTHLVYQLQRSGGAVAVGGPNLTPPDGRLAACIAAGPGQPTHVLLSDQVAEHIPGCNMAFRRDALEAIGGFDAAFRTAGDDVDVCWRLQQAGQWITFAPGGFVWHHRRQTPRTYLRQQAGYGEAEALLRFKHPDQFNGRGNGKWRGVVYGGASGDLRLGRGAIHRGIFGGGLFQCLYQPASAHWALLPSTLEWQAAALVVAGTASLFSLFAGLIALTALLLLPATGIAALLAMQAPLAPEHRDARSRLLVGALCYAQPLVRSWSRYLTRLRSLRTPRTEEQGRFGSDTQRLPLTGACIAEYWCEEWHDRTELLERLVAALSEWRWAKTIDPGWSDWDVEVYCHPWTAVQVRTVQESYGQGRRVVRVQHRLRLTKLAQVAGAAGIAAVAVVAAVLQTLPAIEIAGGFLVATSLGVWWRGTSLAAKVVGTVDMLAQQIHLVRCEPSQGEATRDGPQRAGNKADVPL